MLTYRHTDKAPKPFSAYSQAVEVPAGMRTLHVSGQVGVSPGRELAVGDEAQHVQVWANIFAILADAGMDASDFISIHGYVTNQDGIALYRKVRDRVMGGHEPASTLLIVSGLADPAWVVGDCSGRGQKGLTGFRQKELTMI